MYFWSFYSLLSVERKFDHCGSSQKIDNMTFKSSGIFFKTKTKLQSKEKKEEKKMFQIQENI